MCHRPWKAGERTWTSTTTTRPINLVPVPFVCVPSDVRCTLFVDADRGSSCPSPETGCTVLMLKLPQRQRRRRKCVDVHRKDLPLADSSSSSSSFFASSPAYDIEQSADIRVPGYGILILMVIFALSFVVNSLCEPAAVSDYISWSCWGSKQSFSCKQMCIVCQIFIISCSQFAISASREFVRVERNLKNWYKGEHLNQFYAQILLDIVCYSRQTKACLTLIYATKSAVFSSLLWLVNCFNNHILQGWYTLKTIQGKILKIRLFY